MNKRSYPQYAAMYFFYFFGMASYVSILSIYLRGIGKSASDVSLIVSASGIFTIASQPFIGAMFDRTRNRRLLCAKLLGFSCLAAVLFSLTERTLFLFLLNGCALAALNSVNPIWERFATGSPYRYGTIRIWGAIGYAAAAQLAAVVYEHVSPRMNFCIYVFGLILALAGFCSIRDNSFSEKPQEKSDVRAASMADIFSVLLKNRGYLLFVVISFLFSGAAGANNTYLPLLLNDKLGSVSLTGTVLFLGTLTEIPLILSSNRFMDRFSGKFLLSANFLLLAVEFAVYSFCPLTAGVCLVVFLCKSTATMLFIMVTLKVVLSLVSEDVSATALSVVNTAKQVGTIVLTWLSGFIADRFDLNAVFYGLLAAACIGLLLSAFLRPSVKKQELFR